MKKTLILADGPEMSKNRLSHLKKDRFLIALDGAGQTAAKYRWTPDLLAGDFDTLSAKIQRHFDKKKVPRLTVPDQNHTDLEKTLAWCIYQGFQSIWIAQAWGGRIDHSLANLIFLKRFHFPRLDLRLFSETESCVYLENQTFHSEGRIKRGMAMIPFPACEVSSGGLAYEMRQKKLELGRAESISNLAKRKRVSLKIQGAALWIETTK